MLKKNFRLPDDLTPNRWARLLGETRAEALAAGTTLLDLTISNPTVAGFRRARAELAEALCSGEIENYSPSPRGSDTARRAVAEFYKNEHGVEISPEQIRLTASTSEAYSLLAKLLCAAGDNVLAPAPSYPLIEHLCRLELVDTRRYFLRFDERAERWTPDFASLKLVADERSRAVFCVAPNNPTGSVFSGDERARLLAFSRERALPIVVDEVFAEYPSGGNDASRGKNSPRKCAESFAGATDAPIFVLGGLSKTAALPQMKIGWIVTCGEKNFVEEASRRLDFISDAYLSVSEPSQCAVPALLAGARAMREKICERLDGNELLLRDWAATSPHGVRILPREAGWYAIVRLPKGVDEDAICTDLLRREKTVVHPGWFYDLEGVPAPHLVISLLTPPGILAAALPRLDSALLRN